MKEKLLNIADWAIRGGLIATVFVLLGANIGGAQAVLASGPLSLGAFTAATFAGGAVMGAAIGAMAQVLGIDQLSEEKEGIDMPTMPTSKEQSKEQQQAVEKDKQSAKEPKESYQGWAERMEAAEMAKSEVSL